MLILSRKINESIIIDGKIIIKILRIEKETVKLGIQAPAELSVHRQEIQDLIDKGRQNGSKANHETSPLVSARHSASDIHSEPRGVISSDDNGED